MVARPDGDRVLRRLPRARSPGSGHGLAVARCARGPGHRPPPNAPTDLDDRRRRRPARARRQHRRAHLGPHRPGRGRRSSRCDGREFLVDTGRAAASRAAGRDRAASLAPRPGALSRGWRPATCSTSSAPGMATAPAGGRACHRAAALPRRPSARPAACQRAPSACPISGRRSGMSRATSPPACSGSATPRIDPERRRAAAPTAARAVRPAAVPVARQHRARPQRVRRPRRRAAGHERRRHGQAVLRPVRGVRHVARRARVADLTMAAFVGTRRQPGGRLFQRDADAGG